jgi:hypothetical protein
MPAERRRSERRTLPSEHLDVTRLEHENLCGQMDEVLRRLRRIEAELTAQCDRIGALEGAVGIGRRNAS